jgi:hypothetical protein
MTKTRIFILTSRMKCLLLKVLPMSYYQATTAEESLLEGI